MKARKTVPVTVSSASSSIASPPAPFEDPVLDELSQKMLSWSKVWFGSPKGSEATAEHKRVRERLLYWVKCCIGGKADAVLTKPDQDVSLAASTPLLTALLGRRAMLELSRRVLNDS